MDQSKIETKKEDCKNKKKWLQTRQISTTNVVMLSMWSFSKQSGYEESHELKQQQCMFTNAELHKIQKIYIFINI